MGVQAWCAGYLPARGGSRTGSGGGGSPEKQPPRGCHYCVQGQHPGLLPVPHAGHPPPHNAMPRCPFSSGQAYPSVLIPVPGLWDSQMTWAKLSLFPGFLELLAPTRLQHLQHCLNDLTMSRLQGLLAGKDYALLTTTDRLGMQGSLHLLQKSHL